MLGLIVASPGWSGKLHRNTCKVPSCVPTLETRFISSSSFLLLVTSWPRAFFPLQLSQLSTEEQSVLGRNRARVCKLPSPRWTGVSHITAETSKRKARGSHRTYKEIFTALGPIEPFHHGAGLHLLPLHAGDAAQLHGVALDSLRLRGHFHTHREADADCRVDA